MASRIKLRKDPKDRLGLVFGTGMRIGTSNFHGYNHGLVLTERIAFQLGACADGIFLRLFPVCWFRWRVASNIRGRSTPHIEWF
jgi:hypothetical protein